MLAMEMKQYKNRHGRTRVGRGKGKGLGGGGGGRRCMGGKSLFLNLMMKSLNINGVLGRKLLERTIVQEVICHVVYFFVQLVVVVAVKLGASRPMNSASKSQTKAIN